MAFDPYQFLRHARTYLACEKDLQDAGWRSAVSRAYYGAFLQARDSAGITGQSASVHENTATYYLNRHSSAVGNRLAELRRLRNSADYDLRCTISRRDAETCIKKAQRIFAELRVDLPLGDDAGNKPAQ